MNKILTILNKLGYHFHRQYNEQDEPFILVELEYTFRTYDGWDSDCSCYGEYKDMTQAIETVYRDVLIERADEKLLRMLDRSAWKKNMHDCTSHIVTLFALEHYCNKVGK